MQLLLLHVHTYLAQVQMGVKEWELQPEEVAQKHTVAKGDESGGER